MRKQRVLTFGGLVVLVFVVANLYYLGGEFKIPFTEIGIAWASTNSTCAGRYNHNIGYPWCNCMSYHGECTNGLTCTGASSCKSSGCGGMDCEYIDTLPCGVVKQNCPDICAGRTSTPDNPRNTPSGSRNCSTAGEPIASCRGVMCP